MRVPYQLNVRHVHKAKKSRATILLLHGLGDTADMWQPVLAKLPDGMSVAAVDLLGFGESPRPAWEAYDARAQVRSLLTTCLRLRLKTPLIIVGHSLGSLVAVEFAMRYPLLVRSLVLCSPPIYRHPSAGNRTKGYDMVLRSLYGRAAADPGALLRIYALARATRMLPVSIKIDETNVQMLIASLRASIINQTAIDDITRLSKPIRIISGLFDPLVVRANLVRVAQQSDMIRLKHIPAAHGLNAAFVKEIVATVAAMSADG